jgi:hypothetical protein
MILKNTFQNIWDAPIVEFKYLLENRMV